MVLNSRIKRMLNILPEAILKSQRLPLKWEIVGASATGNNHLNNNIPCQDAYHYSMISKNTGIAVLADGAGSYEYSHLGSDFVVKQAVKEFTDLVYEEGWHLKQHLPDEETWSRKAYEKMIAIQKALFLYTEALKLPFDELSATLIVLIFSDEGLLVTHIGDGRAGYCNGEKEWKPAIEPYEGDEVGSTAFITQPIAHYPHLVRSNLIKDNITAFTLMSDGCEKLCWRTREELKEEKRIVKINKPFVPFFNATVKILREIFLNGNAGKIQEEWEQYLINGHEAFAEEGDDKTLIIGILC